jgi:triacylglycerol lipase
VDGVGWNRAGALRPLLGVLGVLALAGAGCGGSAGGGGAGDPDDAGLHGDAAAAVDAALPGSDGALPGSDGAVVTTDAGDGTDPGPDLLGPPYPIVLAHGFFGFDELFGVVDYWWQIPETLAAAGETQVFVTTVDPFNSSTVRGDQLIAQIENILASTGHAKVNIIGHSQGGLDARVVAHERPDLVASATTIATPHQGSEVADLVEALSGDLLVDLLNALLQLIGPALWDMIDDGSDISAGLYLFSQAGIAEFNETYTDSPGVRYYSVTGTSGPEYGTTSPSTGPCSTVNPPAFITKWFDDRDAIDPLLSLTEWYLSDYGLNRNEYRNDGLVRASSGQWGRFLGCIPADHLDEVGQLFGAHPGCYWHWNGWYWERRCNDFDYLEFYLDLVDFVRAEGF